MNLFRRTWIFAVLWGLAGFAPASAAATEVLEYDVSWVGVSVGTVKSTCSRALARLRSRGEAAPATRSLP